MADSPGAGAPALQTLRGRQTVLVVASLGAAVIMLGVGPVWVSLIGLGIVLAATVAAAPAGRNQPGGGWWTMLAAGATLSLLGALIAIVLDGLGGLIAVAGAVLVIIGAAIGFPLAPAETADDEPVVEDPAA